ncbi:MAG TPA: amidohydrolase family protein [Rhizomicrobium sp.]|jgi:imidazolonepropionase-like amidohydrolase
MTSILFENARLFDGETDHLRDNVSVLVEGERIREVADGAIKSRDAERIDLKGRTLMPGLIDAHFHAYATELDLGKAGDTPRSLHALEARVLLENALKRGFTTVRDAAGADYGLARATERGLIKGPRIFYSGRAITQTGGHGDFRGPAKEFAEPCACASSNFMSWVADGPDEVRKAAREELRKGADQIKIFVSGGISSPSDPVWMPQFSDDEIRAAVAEAATRRTYVLAHAYTAESIALAVRCGVRSIEHGNLIDRAAAEAVRKHEAFVVPTLVTYDAFHKFGREGGAPEFLLKKLEDVRTAGLGALSILEEVGVQTGFGTDLLGELHVHQSEEFLIRAQVMKPIDILRSATGVNARLLNRAGELGVVKSGALADLVVVDGDPLEDLSLLTHQGAHMPIIMKGGAMMKMEIV